MRHNPDAVRGPYSGVMLGAAFAVLAVLAVAGVCLLLIADWGSERANRNVRRTRRTLIGLSLALIAAAAVAWALDPFPLWM